MYFDSEINRILDNVKGYQPVIHKDRERTSQKYINSFKEKLLENDPENKVLQEQIPNDERARTQILEEYSKNPNLY